ncbi:MAG TPA: trehalase family glycosidase [Acidobacteriaceae bacterium]|nr:trehalase family glycosidase [Acidobacteriaceae bacterium]
MRKSNDFVRGLGLLLVALLATTWVLHATNAHPKPGGARTLATLSANFTRLAPETIQPAQGYIKHDYLIPAGYYPQMWDWDGFFIGAHWANQNPADAKYLRDWAIAFASSADPSGYVAGCITPDGSRPLFGKFSMKPFLAQGALLAARRLHDFSWIAPIWPAMQRIARYRDRTQFDPHWGLYFWDNAMQSGADNNAALSNDPKDRGAILAVDASVYTMREYQAMEVIARHLGHPKEAARYRDKAESIRRALVKNLWSPKDAMFWNRRRDNGQWIRRMSYSNFTPLITNVLPPAEARRMIRRHLLNPDEMRSPYGFRSLARSDPDFNNRAIINPYSNWRGPIWINANYLDWIALRRYGFLKQSQWLALSIAAMLNRDIAKWGSMHEDYNSETGDGLAPTPEQSPHGHFAGFVGWDLLAQGMLQCEVEHTHCMMLRVDR